MIINLYKGMSNTTPRLKYSITKQTYTYYIFIQYKYNSKIFDYIYTSTDPTYNRDMYIYWQLVKKGKL